VIKDYKKPIKRFVELSGSKKNPENMIYILSGAED
jgi:hypothetical protein